MFSHPHINTLINTQSPALYRPKTIPELKSQLIAIEMSFTNISIFVSSIVILTYMFAKQVSSAGCHARTSPLQHINMFSHEAYPRAAPSSRPKTIPTASVLLNDRLEISTSVPIFGSVFVMINDRQTSHVPLLNAVEHCT